MRKAFERDPWNNTYVCESQACYSPALLPQGEEQHWLPALWEMLRRVVLVLNPFAGWPCSSHSDSRNFDFLIYNIKELAWLTSNLFVGVSNIFHHSFIPDYCSFTSLMHQRSQVAYIGIQLLHRSSSFKVAWDSIRLQLYPQIRSYGH